jgi:uncharacterized membrane protein YjfL (UPF0719 family)
MAGIVVSVIVAAAMLGLLVLARGLFALIGKFEGYNLTDQSVRQDNPALGIRFALFLFAIVLSFSQVLPAVVSGTIDDLPALARNAVLVIATLFISRYIADYFIFHSLSLTDELIRKRNVAVAIVEGGAQVGTAFIIAGTLVGFDEAPLESLQWLIIGQVLLVVLSLIYRLLIPGLLPALEVQNHACALAFAGLLAASGIALGAAVSGPSQGWLTDLTNVAVYMGGWLIFVLLGTILSDRLMFPSYRLRNEIMDERNIAAGVLEGAILVGLTLLYSYVVLW